MYTATMSHHVQEAIDASSSEPFVYQYQAPLVYLIYKIMKSY